MNKKNGGEGRKNKKQKTGNDKETNGLGKREWKVKGKEKNRIKKEREGRNGAR